MSRYIRARIPIVVTIVLLGFMLLTQSGRNGQSVVDFLGSATPTPTPTPIPFAELTIPYLRNRAYSSTLGERKQFSANATYTTYLTSYDSDGLTIHGLLTIPNDRQFRHPAVVFVHGYIPPSQYRTTQNYQSYVEYLARNGFVVFKIDLRGHDQSEGEPGGAYYSSDYVIDTLNARAALLASDFVAPDRVGLWGHSMAGNVVMRSFATVPTIPAVVVWAGAGYTYADLSTYRISDTSYQPPVNNTQRQRFRQLLRDTYGEFNTNIPFWRQVAVTDYLSDLRGAVEIHHAADDAVVSVEYSRNLMKLLDETSIPHKLYEYTSGGHNLSGSSFTTAMQRTVEFFQKHLR